MNNYFLIRLPMTATQLSMKIRFLFTTQKKKNFFFLETQRRLPHSELNSRGR